MVKTPNKSTVENCLRLFQTLGITSFRINAETIADNHTEPCQILFVSDLYGQYDEAFLYGLIKILLQHNHYNIAFFSKQICEKDGEKKEISYATSVITVENEELVSRELGSSHRSGKKVKNILKFINYHCDISFRSDDLKEEFTIQKVAPASLDSWFKISKC